MTTDFQKPLNLHGLGIEGQVAPDWAVSHWHQLPDGAESLNVSDYRGRVLFLYFFQSWCSGCHSIGFPRLKRLQQEFSSNGDIAFVAIQTTFEGHTENGPDKLQPTADQYQVKIPFGQSADNTGTPEIMHRYRTGGTPWVVIIDKKGTVAFNDFHLDLETARKMLRSLSLQPSLDQRLGD